MQSPYQPTVIKNEYEPKSAMRTVTGVLSSLMFMGLPVGMVELLRPGGDRLTWEISFVAVILAAVLAVFSIRGTLKE
jgi:hypothetical protein